MNVGDYIDCIQLREIGIVISMNEDGYGDVASYNQYVKNTNLDLCTVFDSNDASKHYKSLQYLLDHENTREGVMENKIAKLLKGEIVGFTYFAYQTTWTEGSVVAATTDKSFAIGVDNIVGLHHVYSLEELFKTPSLYIFFMTEDKFEAASLDTALYYRSPENPDEGHEYQKTLELILEEESIRFERSLGL